MRAQVRRGRKGRWSVFPVLDRQIEEQDLFDLAHELRKIDGVKRAVARLHENRIYLRVNEGMKGLFQLVRKRANQFLGRRYAPPVSRRSRPSATVRPDPARATRRRLQQGPALAR